MAATLQRNALLLQKASLSGLRRGAVSSPSVFPLAGAAWQQVSSRSTQTKPAVTVMTPEAAQQNLARQRLQRPVAPHLGIYKWQVHSVSSAMERNTGILMSGGLYLFATAYLASPYLGWDLSSTALVTAFGALPLAAKVGIKFLVAWPFTFHLFGGVRYLATATARTLDNKAQFIKIAWAVVGTSAVAAAGLAVY
ncbi:hypothetical protein BO78DRAFT_361758 [Aspergillus sclerotiicarbonarius CBS 121057]|uniref:Cytochrome b560 subunit of succinate dehydrogenase n=1 Tax=Aspergillus sclerotiicarbonarius (strain CBS 121057 / IBT 28362) TaxID=1448318 RepID=A0A319EI30_ASPSB|nr:hypothetical protein BO78DRAFT_361758 [Aspergillus sclerotiicarbonarius CBS 121057]